LRTCVQRWVYDAYDNLRQIDSLFSMLLGQFSY
jgi:hypothetical protein